MSIVWGEQDERRQREHTSAVARALVGCVVRFNHQGDEAAAYTVTRAIDDMVELDGLPGRFATHLFRVLRRGVAAAS